MKRRKKSRETKGRTKSSKHEFAAIKEKNNRNKIQETHRRGGQLWGLSMRILLRKRDPWSPGEVPEKKNGLVDSQPAGSVVPS